MKHQLHPAVQALLHSHNQPRVTYFIDPLDTCLIYDFDVYLNPWHHNGSNYNLVSIDLAENEVRIRLMDASDRTCLGQTDLQYSSTLNDIVNAILEMDKLSKLNAD